MRENTLLITAKLNRKTDADIIAAIEGSAGSRASRIKELLRKGIEAERKQ
jgi:predicted regulator of Ras-like GTPase activity (Roadblock/LC7/MglB family)